VKDYISLYINVGFISEGSEDTATESTENRQFSSTHFRLTPRPRIPANIDPHKSYIARNQSPRTTLSHLILIVWIYLHSNFHGASKGTCILKQSAWWPFKVIQGRCLRYQSKARMQLPIGHHSSIYCIVTLVLYLLRFRDIAGFLLKTATSPL